MGSLTTGEDNLTLPAIVDSRAQTQPDRLYGATTSIGDDGKVNLKKITYYDMSNAVNRCAQWLESRFGKSTDYTTIAYAGPSDYRYTIVAMAAAKTGHKALLLAPWNPTIAQLRLLDECKCDIFLTAEEDEKTQAMSKAISAERKIQIHQFPTLSWVLDGPKAPHYPFQKTLDEVRYEDYVIIHTSGSTGHPGPMTYKFGAIAAQRYLANPTEVLPDAPPTNIQKIWSDRCHLMALPACHMGGVLGLGPFNIYWNMPMILAPPTQPIDANIVHQILSFDICDAAFIPPAYLQALSRNPSQLDILHRLKHVLWVGAAFTSPEVASTIKSRAPIHPAYGSSEAGPFAFIPLPASQSQSDHDWWQFHPIMGAQLRHFSDDLYECVLVRDPAISKAQFIFQNFPDKDEWATKDLFSPHPDRPDLWRFRGRKDDIILLPNARNVDPALIEATVSGHPKVKAALLSGSGRMKTALLIETAEEPPQNEEERKALLEEVWPSIEKGNEISGEWARVTGREMVVFAVKEKPFRRAGKGSVQRNMTLGEYREEIDALYGE